MEILKLAIEDKVLSSEEKKDIIWMCNKFKTKNIYYDIITSDIQILQGIFHGIMADGKVSTEEIKGLKSWAFENEHLKGTYPYDELCSLIITILKDGKVDENEEKILKVFFSEFIDIENSKNINLEEINKLKSQITIQGICSLDPEIIIEEKKFCFTGASKKAKRMEFKSIVEEKGGFFFDNIRKDIDYLIIGNAGNPCWAYTCYGRKVEEAKNLRQNGFPIQIVNEIDFWDFLH
ncbi:MAG: BRCT domain-containing protein [Leptospiraceae bacterium]|nr:BRCT domain-containing protein [Leptospiraceae bacterium]